MAVSGQEIVCVWLRLFRHESGRSLSSFLSDHCHFKSTCSNLESAPVKNFDNLPYYCGVLCSTSEKWHVFTATDASGRRRGSPSLSVSLLPTKVASMVWLPLTQAVDVGPVSVLSAVVGLWALRRLIRIFTTLRAPSLFPKLYSAWDPMALPGVLLPTTWWNVGYSGHWIRRFRRYTGNETMNLVSVLGGTSGLWTSNLDIARQVSAGGHKTSFVKPEMASGALLLWGMNLVAADGQMWRKHRRIVGPAFGTELYKLVWKQTAQTYRDMVQTEGWNDKDVVNVPVIQNITTKVAFLIISACGFGFPSTWETPTGDADNEIPVQEALRVVAETYLLMLTVPEWVLHLPIPRFKKARMARDRLRTFMQQQVTERKAEVAAGNTRADAFTMLVKANQDEAGKYQLDDQELIGNVFLFMFAGHETTAHTLAATLGFMALHPEIQDEVLDQIIAVVGPDRAPVFEDYPKLDKVLAIFYEAARMFPAGHILIREATEDTVLTVPNPVGEEGSKTIPIPKGTQVTVDMVGVQYNPRYFENAEEYRPSRWYGLPSDSELFTAFSVGPRACLGRRFALVEAACFLTLLLRDWKISPILNEGESKRAWETRVMDAHIALTLGVANVSLQFERRKRA